MKYYNLRCEVPGELGNETIFDKCIIPWEIKHLHVVFQSWLGGEILAVSSYLLVSDALMKKMFFEFSGIKGYETFQLEISQKFKELQPNVILPNFIPHAGSFCAQKLPACGIYFTRRQKQCTIFDRVKYKRLKVAGNAFVDDIALTYYNNLYN